MNCMIRKFYNSSDLRLLKEQCNIMFEEVSDGVYLVVKDRCNKYKAFATSQIVAEALNHLHGVVVVHKNGISGYANYQKVKGADINWEDSNWLYT
jgi:hypothetical protein